MRQPSKPRLDAATAISLGRREHQEDAVICDCPLGGEVGLVVLSDGMGGYRSGDMASKIVMTEVFSELKLNGDMLATPEADAGAILKRAADGANACIRAFVEESPSSAGMGATLVAGVLRGMTLRWVSVGDSSLHIFRAGELFQLNQDHSFGSVMRAMVAEGRLGAEMAARHPERSSLLSVLSGGPIALVDCPRAPYRLLEGDVVIFASDGLAHLDEGAIRNVLRANAAAPSAGIAQALMRAIEALDDPDQDNVSLAVIRVGEPVDIRAGAPHRRPIRGIEVSEPAR